MVRDVGINDLALIELNKHGATDAPAPVLAQLERAGYLALQDGAPTLTAAGRTRAKSLAPAEGNLRLMASTKAAGGCALTTAGGASLHG